MMSKYLTLFRTVLLATLLLMLSVGLTACGQTPKGNGSVKPSNDPTGKIASSPLTVLSIVGGDVLIMKPGEKEWVRGEAGMTLGVDYKVKTKANGNATLTFFEGSTIELKSDTEIGLAELVIAETTNTIKLKQTLGETISKVKKLADPASRYEIETPAAVAAVRGSIMYVTVAQDGKTIVGNMEGLISVIAQGVEVKLPVNTRVTIMPGYPPEQPQSGATSKIPVTAASTSIMTQPVPTPAVPTTVVTTSTTQLDTEIVKLTISNSPNRQQAYPGDSIIYTYTVGNAGNVPLSNISVMDNMVGQADYQAGDTNANQVMDISETWIFKANYIVKSGDVGQLTNVAVVSGVSPKNKNATASSTAVVNITSIVVKITSLKENSVVGNTITVAGIVNDPSIKQAIITVNGNPSNVSVNNGNFSTTVSLAGGINTITVTVIKAADITASDTVELVPVQ
jgi:hypothetical protein